MWAAPLYSPVKYSWSRTFLSVNLNGLAQIEQLVASFSCPFLSSASGSLILYGLRNLHLSKCFFNTPSLVQPCKQYWQKYRCDYYIISIPVYSSFLPIRNVIFHQQWYIVNLCHALQGSWWSYVTRRFFYLGTHRH